jgi:hypothetical protein
MGRPFVPVHELAMRPPVHGKIRMGEKGPKGQPQKLKNFRFTTADKDALQQVADLYGGSIVPWPEQKGQWQVKTEASEINVVLPREPLAPITYELWTGGGIQRRCNGEKVETPVKVQGGVAMQMSPCICNAKEEYDCKPKIRLSVVLPEVKFGGVWLLESSSWNAAAELPGMVDMIQELQTRNFQRAVLAIEERKKVIGGQTRQFIVPVLRPAVSMMELMEGSGSLLALAPASQAAPALPAADQDQDQRDRHEDQREDFDEVGVFHDPKVDTAWEDDEDIVDAEIVEEVERESAPAPSSTSPDLEKRRKKMHAVMKELGMGVTERHALVKRITNGRSSSSNDLDEGGMDMLLSALDAIRKADAFYDGEDANGMAIVSKR